MRQFVAKIVLMTFMLVGTTHTQMFDNASAAEGGDAVLRWNDIALQAQVIDHTPGAGVPGAGEKLNAGPTKAARALAMMHLAMFDAANAIEKQYTSYLVQPLSATGALRSVAIAQAAHDTLIALYPSQSAFFHTALLDDLALVPDGEGKVGGIAAGAAAAQLIIAARTNDGNDVSGTYTPSHDPGHWRPDPLHPTQTAYGDYYGSVKPFVLNIVSDFLVKPVPTLTSTGYTAAFNEVKSLGSVDSVLRTEEQKQIGYYWGYDGSPGLGVPPRLYNQITRLIATEKGNTEMQNARLFALVNLSMIDGGIAAWKAKYQYDFWRPVTGIREADEGTGPTGLGDGNIDTVGDPTWTPLGAPASNPQLSATPDTPPINFTPPFPAYTSGHATFGAAAFSSIANFYGTDDIPFTFTSDELNGVTKDQDGSTRPLVSRSFTTLSQASYENAQSRIYLGIHWGFDRDVGLHNGKQVADYVFAHFAQPLVPQSSSSSISSSQSSVSSSTSSNVSSSLSSSSSSSVSLVSTEESPDIQKIHQEQILSHSHRGHGTTEAAQVLHYLADLHGMTSSYSSTSSVESTHAATTVQSVSNPPIVKVGKKKITVPLVASIKNDNLVGHSSAVPVVKVGVKREIVTLHDTRELTEQEKQFVCSMQKFLHQDARLTRMNTLMPWTATQLASMLALSPEEVEVLLHDETICR